MTESRQTYTMEASHKQQDKTCTGCDKTPPGFFARYRSFLLSSGTLITTANATLLLAGFLAGLTGRTQVADWLYLASAIIGGAPISKLAASNILRRFDLTAGVMVSIAMIAAIIVGEYSAAAFVALMMLVGEVLEDLTVARADNALSELAGLVPDIVTIRRQDRDIDVQIDQVRPGDLVLVRPGGRIPVDGLIQNGHAAVDQSAITGESMPIDKEPGDLAYAGTLCTNGSLEIVTNCVGQETAIGNMIALVQKARDTQAPVQRVASRYAQYLTPIALVIAIITYLLTKDITRSITVLIVICPCSLVLATPTAIAAAVGNAAKHGILVKHGPAMEQIGKVDVVAFDKTGTLTLGEPHVQETISLNGMAPQQILALAASAERSSEHSLARAIVASASHAKLEIGIPSEFESLPGHGVRATIRGHEVIIGSRMLASQGITVPKAVQAKADDLGSHGDTVVPVSIDKQIAGLVVISDTIRPASKQAVASLKKLDIRETVLISGDSRAVAEAIGDELGVDRVYSETLPEQKLAIIRELQASGRKVAYVGDGVNDAPALAAADVGIAMGNIGTSVAIETADIVLLTDNITSLSDLVDLGRTGLRVIRNNVIFAMSMNVLSVVLSTLGVIGPVVGAIMHEASALPVVANSARLIARQAKSANAN